MSVRFLNNLHSAFLWICSFVCFGLISDAKEYKTIHVDIHELFIFFSFLFHCARIRFFVSLCKVNDIGGVYCLGDGM